MTRLTYATPAKHRAPGTAVTSEWTRWPKHRDDSLGTAPADGMEEYQAKWVAAMRVREAENHRRERAWLS